MFEIGKKKHTPIRSHGDLRESQAAVLLNLNLNYEKLDANIQTFVEIQIFFCSFLQFLKFCIF